MPIGRTGLKFSVKRKENKEHNTWLVHFRAGNNRSDACHSEKVKVTGQPHCVALLTGVAV